MTPAADQLRAARALDAREIGEVRRMAGQFVGSLHEHDIRLFQRAVDAGLAYRSYEGAGGLMGLAKVRLIDRAIALAEQGDA